MNKNIEIRSLRETPNYNEETREVSGYAIVWDVESRIMWDGEEFVEVISRGAITEDDLAKSDVKALFNHRHDYLLARSVNGQGTLGLTIDEVGLRFSFIAPETTWGNDVLELIKRGDLRGCSFAFVVNPGDVEYTRRKDGMCLRVINKIADLHDVSVVVDPAYLQTTVSARSWEAASASVDTASHEERKKYIKSILNNNL